MTALGPFLADPDDEALALVGKIAAVSEASTRAELGFLVPAECRAGWLDLAWYQPGGCRLLRSWDLGSPS